MKRAVYATARERKIDQLIGLVAFPLVNVLLWLTIDFWLRYSFNELGVSLLPWIVNGGFLSLAFIFRPHIGVGYIVGFGIIIVGIVILGVLFVGACFVSIIVAIPFGILSNELGAAVLCLLFPLLLLVGLPLLGWVGISVFNSWWFSTEE